MVNHRWALKVLARISLLMMTTSVSFAGILKPPEIDISKCVGFLAAMKYLSPEMIDSTADIAGVKMKAVAAKNNYPASTLQAMTDMSSNSASMLVNYVLSSDKSAIEDKVKEILERGTATCKSSGLTIRNVNGKMVVRVDDINEAL